MLLEVNTSIAMATQSRHTMDCALRAPVCSVRGMCVVGRNARTRPMHVSLYTDSVCFAKFC